MQSASKGCVPDRRGGDEILGYETQHTYELGKDGAHTLATCYQLAARRIQTDFFPTPQTTTRLWALVVTAFAYTLSTPSSLVFPAADGEDDRDPAADAAGAAPAFNPSV